MDWRKKTKVFFNSSSAITPKEVFYLFTFTLLTLLLPLSFLLLVRLSFAKYYLQSLTYWIHNHYLLSFAVNVNPSILYVLVSIVSVASLIYCLTGKIVILSESSALPDPTTSQGSWICQPRLYTAWILLCIFQVCVGLGIEGSIEAGFYDSDSSFGIERSLLSRVIFLLGLHETTHVWSRIVVRPVIDDTVFGFERKEKWIEKVAIAFSLGTLWWCRLRDDVDNLVVVGEVKKGQLMDVRMGDFFGWWLYYLTVTIGTVRTVKGLVWMGTTVCLCRRRVEPSENDDKV